jgi:hypothetical protein
MMNLVGLKARNIKPKNSTPGEIQDFELIFYGAKGVAAAKPSPGKSFHGVLHKCTDSDMAVLDKIEATVSRTSAKAKLYDGSIVDVTVYSNPPANTDRSGDKPPTERYVDIMIQGAEMFGVKPEYINKLKNMKKQPRPKVSEYRQHPIPDGVPTWS